MLTTGPPGEGARLQQLGARVGDLEAEHDILMMERGRAESVAGTQPVP